MRIFKKLFAALLLIQVCSSAWASTYGHPDAETIDVGRHSSQPTRDQFIIEAAIRRGMDGEAVAELLRTKQPVVKVKAEPNGVTKTTTYSLDADGSISSKTVTETRSIKHFESGNLPDSLALDDILNSPSGTVTRTFTDKDGAKVTQTFGLSKPKTTSIFDSDSNDDWYRQRIPTWSGSPETSTHIQRSWSSEAEEGKPTNFHKTTRTYSGPETSTHIQRSWSSEAEEGKPANFHKTTRTYSGPNGEKRVVETWSSEPETNPTGTRFPSSKWPSFEFPDFPQPWQPTDTLGNPGEWTVIEGNPDVEATTKHMFQSWTPKTWQFPEYPTYQTPTTTTAKPTRVPMQPKVTTPLPSLDDFLKTQYRHTTTTTKTATTTAKPKAASSFTTTTKKPITIKVEDLPITHILHNGEPADESIIRTLAPHMVPKANTENVLKVDNIHPIDEDAVPKKVETNVRKITKTHIGNSKPTLKDLDPQMQEILRNAGISPDDISNIEGDTITKTRKEPDGRVITTTYKVRTSPSNRQPETTAYEETKPTVFSTSHHHSPVEFPNHPHLTPVSANKPSSQPSPISEFLAKLGLTKADILSRNGEYTRTFIEDDGQVLTATFVLSTPLNQHVSSTKKKPLK